LDRENKKLKYELLRKKRDLSVFDWITDWKKENEVLILWSFYSYKMGNNVNEFHIRYNPAGHSLKKKKKTM